jgi:ankyrin repeat protein
VIVLLAHGAEVNAVALNPTLLQPLHSAVASRDLATVMAVLAAKPEINARQIRGFVALHSAALSGDVLIVRALLDAGADASLQADDGKRALDFARERGHGALESLLA